MRAVGWNTNVCQTALVQFAEVWPHGLIKVTQNVKLLLYLSGLGSWKIKAAPLS